MTEQLLVLLQPIPSFQRGGFFSVENGARIGNLFAEVAELIYCLTTRLVIFLRTFEQGLRVGLRPPLMSRHGERMEVDL